MHKAGYDVTLLYCFWINWATGTDEKLLRNAGFRYKLVGGSPPKRIFGYIKTQLRFKMCRYLNKFIGNKYLIAERAQARCYDELLNAAKKIKADWYIGHNLGALAIAANAAKINNGRSGFDFEDYHRMENAEIFSWEEKRIEYLENKYVPSLNYVSCASEMIKDFFLLNFSTFSNPVIAINNCFSLQLKPNFVEKSDPNALHLFWFSQTVGKNRGLEVVIDALNILNDMTIHLTLAGNCTDEMKTFLNTLTGDLKNNLHFVGIIPPDDLPTFSAKFDIGMATEINKPLNRDICLTNKIFTYLLAGNAVILSETRMQLAFNKMYFIGESYPVANAVKLAEKIQLYKDPDKLLAQRSHNFKLATSKLNWEQESSSLLKIL